MTTRIDGGGVGRAYGRVLLAGMDWFVGGNVSVFHGHGHGLRRSFYGAPVHETTEERARVSAAMMESKVEGSEREMRQQHGTAVSSSTFGCGGASRKLTGSWSFEGVAPPSWRCTEEWRE